MWLVCSILILIKMAPLSPIRTQSRTERDPRGLARALELVEHGVAVGLARERA
jgi:hypothetical protein